ncbi:hypothetical protein HanXRQr2_Chr12g0540831 [Helianthus annuus]|uniref:Uncharacterized protein n=1 Tax=Helianthus annuus TaxID=4232 RepID=A0A9K3HGK4_HELAN|nr:hypothetical protein HanXRQr2_Chr12g0540831 [Helianthus annuus]KAJ0489342.1 hypothetical protein HanHA300_Chr12g0442961 [Helianthus annuus]KAJ0493130.1 hypothetical protein HanIR_Chr12g0582641 [Helianthus annuus]KAJ0505222.1 hypothetical protein HanHA89_Chr12g0468081 [Helianthus annuus]KAJ0674904.1 hypothetical protein HanLR1_Chr12g0445181 [Helianthus annuus]
MSRQNIFCCAQQLILKRPDHMLVNLYRLLLSATVFKFLLLVTRVITCCTLL